MSVLSWGKPKIEISLLDVSGEPTTWIEVDTPVEKTTKLTPTKGAKTTAPLEGGTNRDVKYAKNTYIFEFELYASKGKSKPVSDSDGVISGFYAMRLTPEDDTVDGIMIPKAIMSVEDSFDSDIGKKWKYTLDVLQPDTGNQIANWNARALVLSTTELYFSSAADNTGKTVTATTSENISATSSDSSWCTVTCSGQTATVKVTANSTSSVRTATITIEAGGNQNTVSVLQIPASA